MASEGRRHGPKVGLSAEDWVRMWDTDFAELTGGADHHHDESSHGHHSHGDHDPDHEGCGGQNHLKKFLPRLTRDKPSVSFLVSLCGDSSDVEFLAELGHSVTGIEVSEKAVKSIFEKSHKPIPYSVTSKGPFKVYTATDNRKMTIYVGNVFDTLPGEVGQFDAIWDGHGIVSLPEKDMQPYADKLKQLLKPEGAMLFSTISYDVSELKKGPAPCPISTAELTRFFSDDYEIELLEDGDFENPDLEGVTKCTNPIHLITRKN